MKVVKRAKGVGRANRGIKKVAVVKRLKGVGRANMGSLTLPKSMEGVILKEISVSITKQDFLNADRILKEEEKRRFDEQRHRYEKSGYNYAYQFTDSYQLDIVRRQVRDLEEQARKRADYINVLGRDHKNQLAGVRKQVRYWKRYASEQEEYINDLEHIYKKKFRNMRKQVRDLKKQADQREEEDLDELESYYLTDSEAEVDEQD